MRMCSGNAVSGRAGRVPGSEQEVLLELAAREAEALRPLPGQTRRDTGAGWYEDALGYHVFVNARGQRVRRIDPITARPQAPPPITFSEGGGLSRTQRNAQSEAEAQAATYMADQQHLNDQLTPKPTFDLRGAVKGMLMAGGLPNPGDHE